MMLPDQEMVTRFLRGENEAVGTVDGWISRAAWPYQRRPADRWGDGPPEGPPEGNRPPGSGEFRGRLGRRPPGGRAGGAPPAGLGEVRRRVEPAHLPLAGGQPYLPRPAPGPEQVEVDRPRGPGPGGRAGQHGAGHPRSPGG